MADVLLVEPDKVMGKTYRRALEAARHRVAVAADAQTAIHQIDKQRPQLIITELQLAEHNGVEFLYELRSYPEWQTIPVIVLSSIPPDEAGLSEVTQEKLCIVQYCYKPHTTLQHLSDYVSEAIKS